MADTKISGLSSVAPADGDYVPGVDISDTTQSVAGTTKRFLFSAIWTYISGKIGTIGALAAKNTVAAGDIDADAVTTAKILNGAVTLAKQANIATARLMGRLTAGSGVQEELTGTQVTSMLDLATASLKGLGPAFPNNTTSFLRGDGSYADPIVGANIETALDARYGSARWRATEVPAAGTTGQVLKKSSNTDYDYAWAADGGGGGSLGSVAEDILPDADGTRDVGSVTLRFAEGHFDVLDINGTTIDGATVADPGADAIATWDDSATAGTEYGFGTYGQGLTQVGRNPQITDNVMTDAIEFVIDGGGATITTGVKGFLLIPFGCTIQQVSLLADQSGSIVVDVWKDTYANYPPTVADTITASAKPTISSATKAQDGTLTGWTTAISAGDIIGFNVDSVTTCQRVTICLKVKKT